MKLYKFIFIAIALMCSNTYDAIGQKATPLFFTLNSESLKKNKTGIDNKDQALMAACKQLISDADKKAMAFGPVSVMEKKGLPPSGDKHDYMSLAPYNWPDPTKPGGLPYIRKDGQTNPEVKNYPDKENMPRLCEYVYTLGLAYYFSGENKYAEHATKLVRVWFLDAETKMNPNLNYAQAIKGVNEGRGAGLIDTRHWIKLIDGIGLIKNSTAWKKEDQQGMQQWFTEFLNWMQTSKNGTDELKAKNNHGAWYDAQRMSIALFIDSVDLARSIAQNAANRLDYQLDEKGFFPAEMERTTSLHYTIFALQAFFNIAKMSAPIGFDFWNYTTPSGKSLRKAFDVVRPYLTGEKTWEGQQIKPFDFEEGYPILMDGSVHFNCGDCERSIKQLAGDKAHRLRLNLIY